MVTESASWQTFWWTSWGGWSRGGSDSLPETRNSEKLPERHRKSWRFTPPPPSRKCPRNVHQKFGRKEAGSSFQSSFFRRELLVERGSSACKVRHYQQFYSSTSHPKWATVASLNISFFCPLVRNCLSTPILGGKTHRTPSYVLFLPVKRS